MASLPERKRRRTLSGHGRPCAKLPDGAATRAREPPRRFLSATSGPVFARFPEEDIEDSKHLSIYNVLQKDSFFCDLFTDSSPLSSPLSSPGAARRACLRPCLRFWHAASRCANCTTWHSAGSALHKAVRSTSNMHASPSSVRTRASRTPMAIGRSAYAERLYPDAMQLGVDLAAEASLVLGLQNGGEVPNATALAGFHRAEPA